jgi:hypothetical protein
MILVATTFVDRQAQPISDTFAADLQQKKARASMTDPSLREWSLQ